MPFFIMLHISKPNLHIFLEKNMQIIQMIACVSAYSVLKLYAERLVLYEKIRLLLFE